jgi:hypothetical protein
VSNVSRVEKLARSKAQNDFYDDIHYRRLNNQDSTLCGLKVASSGVEGEVSCVRCRQFASGDF